MNLAVEEEENEEAQEEEEKDEAEIQVGWQRQQDLVFLKCHQSITSCRGLGMFAYASPLPVAEKVY